MQKCQPGTMKIWKASPSKMGGKGRNSGWLKSVQSAQNTLLAVHIAELRSLEI